MPDMTQVLKVCVLVLLCAFSMVTHAQAEVGPRAVENSSDPVVLLQLESLNGQLEILKEQVVSLSAQLSSLKGNDVELMRLSTETDNLERELDNALMDISNALAVGDRNMDAATAAISASEAYLNSANIWAAVCALIVAAAAIWGTVRVTRISEDVAKDIAEELTKEDYAGPSNSSLSVVRYVRDAVKKDLEQTPVALMQNDTFKTNLKTLVDTAVAAQLRAEGGGRGKDKALSDDDFES